MKDKYIEGRNIVNDLLSRGFKEIETKELWESLGIDGDRSSQIKIGAQLSGLGIPCVQVGRKRTYVLNSSEFKDVAE